MRKHRRLWSTSRVVRSWYPPQETSEANFSDRSSNGATTWEPSAVTPPRLALPQLRVGSEAIDGVAIERVSHTRVCNQRRVIHNSLPSNSQLSAPSYDSFIHNMIHTYVQLYGSLSERRPDMGIWAGNSR